jgi:predicted phosphodiesterase
MQGGGQVKRSEDLGGHKVAFGLIIFLLVSSSAVGFPLQDGFRQDGEQMGVLPPSGPAPYHGVLPAQAWEEVPPGVPLFVFATIADSHIKYGVYTDYCRLKALRKTRQILANYVEDINAHVPQVGFVVHLGDITDDGTEVEFSWARDILDGLHCPLYPVLGNHDNAQDDGKQGWKDFAGRDSTSYAFDSLGFHFIVIDCTLDPFVPPYVECSKSLRDWVAQDLAANRVKPTFILSHYNMWERPWNAEFDTVDHYEEYGGMAELRQVLEEAGNVLAVINGHVHANRVEVHDGIYYIDVGATLVGKPSIRYFYVFPDRVEVSYAYISDRDLFDYVADLCPHCTCCFDPESVCDFIDGRHVDKRFSIPIPTAYPRIVRDHPKGPDALVLRIQASYGRRVRVTVSCSTCGVLGVALYDVLGRELNECQVWKHESDLVMDLSAAFPEIAELAGGFYFIRVLLHGESATARVFLSPE